jgi:phage terminase small subunit
MPILRNTRHERFAQLLAQGKSAAEAYREAGYKENENARFSASRLLTNANVQQRKMEIQQTVLDGALAQKDDILRILYDLASTPNGDKWVRASDKRAAAVDYARLRGWVIERTEQANVGDFDTMNDLEAAQAIKKQREELDRLHKVAEELARARAH